MRIYDNGIYRDMTTDEIEELEKRQQESQNQVQEEMTIEKRVSAIEDVILNLL